MKGMQGKNTANLMEVGTIGRSVPVVVSQRSGEGDPVRGNGRTRNFGSEARSKTSGHDFCKSAIALKSIPGAICKRERSGKGGGGEGAGESLEGRDKVSATGFSGPGRYLMSLVNSAT